MIKMISQCLSSCMIFDRTMSCHAMFDRVMLVSLYFIALFVYDSFAYAQMQAPQYEQVQRDPKKVLNELEFDKIVQNCGQDRRCRIARLRDKLRTQRILEAKLEDENLGKVLQFYEQREKTLYPRLTRTKTINYMFDSNFSFESPFTGFQLGYLLNEYWQIEGMFLLQGSSMYSKNSAVYDNFTSGYQYRMGITHLNSLENSTSYYGLSFAYMHMESEGYYTPSEFKQESPAHLLYLNYGYDWLFPTGFHFRIGSYLALPLYIGLRNQDSQVNADPEVKKAFVSQFSSYYLGLGICFQLGYSF